MTLVALSACHYLPTLKNCKWLIELLNYQRWRAQASYQFINYELGKFSTANSHSRITNHEFIVLSMMACTIVSISFEDKFETVDQISSKKKK